MAGDADRERVIEALKDAFVRGRLTRDELGERAGQALTARTHADLAALTADIPAAPSAPSAPAGLAPASPARRGPLARAAARSGGCLGVAAVSVWLAFLADPGGPGPNPWSSLAPGFLFLAYVAVCVAVGFALYGAYASVEERHSRESLQPGSGAGPGPGLGPGPGPRAGAGARPGPGIGPGIGPGSRARPGERPDGPGDNPVPPGAGQAHAGLPARKPREHRQHFSARPRRAPQHVRPAPGTA
jgi:DUF1707 SHOCT-like domain